jgi:hypothetical protein
VKPVLLLGLALLAAAPNPAPPKPAPPKAAAPALPSQCQQPASCRGSACPVSITAGNTLPLEFPCPRNGNNQDDVDVFSWNEFLRWNWPATKGCAPDTTKSILGVRSGADGPVLWQTQMQTDDLFVDPGKTPAEWCSATSLFTAAPRPFRHVAKADAAAHVLGGAFENIVAPGGIVTDRDGRWLRFERLVNRDQQQYIRDHNFWNKAGLGDNIVLTYLLSAEFEASWKVLTPAEIRSHRYYTTLATVFNTPDGAPSPGRNPVTLGLVGLHIAHKGPNGWFWSTFEHVDNEKLFSNPKSTAAPNTATVKPPYVELDPKTRKPASAGVNLQRIAPLQANSAINAYYQSLLAGSVFANYRLIGTEWFENSGGAPRHLANLTLEPYTQPLDHDDPKNPNGQKLTGCVACHGLSKWDYSFVYLEAK